MLQGKCGLCKKNNNIVDSHLISRSIYKTLNEMSYSINQPILLNQKKAISISEQISSYFLCNACEQRLSKLGEDHVIRYIYKGKNKFKIHDILKENKPTEKVEKTFWYRSNQISTINFDHFLHFASGVFWKASAGSWNFLGNSLLNNKIGKKYQEQFRKYLLGDCPFPDKAALTMTVSNEIEPPNCIIFPQRCKCEGIFQHRFYIPGVEFVLWIGNLISNDIKNISLSHSSGGCILSNSLSKSTLINTAKSMVPMTKSLGKLNNIVSKLNIVQRAKS